MTEFSGESNSLKRVTKKDTSCNESFHETIGSILTFAQFFGVMPVIGVKTNCASELRFKWYSRRTIYSIAVFVLLACYTGLHAAILWKYGITFNAMSKISNV